MARDIRNFGTLVGLTTFGAMLVISAIALLSLLSIYEVPRVLWTALEEAVPVLSWIGVPARWLIDAYRSIVHSNPLVTTWMPGYAWAIDLALISAVNLTLGLHFARSISDMRRDFLRQTEGEGVHWQEAGQKAWDGRPLTRFFFADHYVAWQLFTTLDFFLVVLGWMFRWYRPLLLLWVLDGIYVFWKALFFQFNEAGIIFPGFVSVLP